MTYFNFLRRHAGFLFFGFSMMGLSNFGQTFFISLYSAEIKASFDLSNTSFGALYSSVTLLSGLALLYSGRLIDHWSLPRFTALTLLGSAIGCFFMGLAENIIALAIALFLLRHFGQGLSSHTGMTAISRAFTAQRGRAVAFIQLGYATSEGILPLLLVAVLMWVGWQQSWLLAGSFLLLLALPVQVYLSRLSPELQAEEAATGKGAIIAGRREVLRDMRFYMLLPLYTSSPFLITGMFFHQVQLAQAYSWSLTALASAFAFYAATKIITSLIFGALIDRYTSLRLFPFAFVPLALGFVVLLLPAFIPPSIAPFIYLIFIGVNLGMAAPLSGALWPELFGTKNLGAIRSMTTAIVIFSTAAAPVLFSALLDMGIGFGAISSACIAYLIVCGGLAFLASRITLADR
ncbi:MAG: MFS transporter [Parvibaculales bacterium]|jgi:MFS family permease